MKDLRVGVIELGMGRGHIQNYQKTEGCEVVAVADVDAERLESGLYESAHTGEPVKITDPV